MSDISVLILAAGMGTRMKSRSSKVMHSLAGRPMISYPLDFAKVLKSKRVLSIVSPAQHDLKEYLKEKKQAFVIQSKPLGTAHAVLAAKKALEGFKGYVLILSGDVPLLKQETILNFVKRVQEKKATLGLITMQLQDAKVYGRVIRDLDSRVIKIKEAKNATPEELQITEANAGVYCVKAEFLFKSLKKIKADELTHEYYLPEIISQAVKENHSIFTFVSSDETEFLGVNNRVDLAYAEKLMRQRINEIHMLNGVTFLDPESTYVDADVSIGADTVVYPGSHLQGMSSIGSSCVIENAVVLKDAKLANGVCVKAMSVIEESKVAEGAVLGPFARIRPGSSLGEKVKVGNFVEIKKSTLKKGAKASHLSYLGDSVIGADANIGCGTITCNYDGKNKHKTKIGDRAFVGSDVQFIAPVSVGADSTIGAGSTITKNVPPKALALSRAEQVVIKSWQPKWKRKKKK